MIWCDWLVIFFMYHHRLSNSHDIYLPPQSFLSCCFTTVKWHYNPDSGLILCYQALSASLTREQKHIVDTMVEAHRLYRAQNGSHSRVCHTVETEPILPQTHYHCSCSPRDFLCVCVCVLSCLSGHMQKKERVCLMLYHLTCRDCCSLPGQCQVRCTGICDPRNLLHLLLPVFSWKYNKNTGSNNGKLLRCYKIVIFFYTVSSHMAIKTTLVKEKQKSICIQHHLSS